MEGAKFPESLTTLSFGASFNQAVEDAEFPEGLEGLFFGDGDKVHAIYEGIHLQFVPYHTTTGSGTQAQAVRGWEAFEAKSRYSTYCTHSCDRHKRKSVRSIWRKGCAEALHDIKRGIEPILSGRSNGLGSGVGTLWLVGRYDMRQTQLHEKKQQWPMFREMVVGRIEIKGQTRLQGQKQLQRTRTV